MKKKIVMTMVFFGFFCPLIRSSESEIKEAQAGVVATIIPQAPDVEQVKVGLNKVQSDKRAQLQQERQERAIHGFVDSVIANTVQKTKNQAGSDGQEKKEAADQGEAVDDSTHTVLIFNDNDEIGRVDQNPAITYGAVAALSQKAGPILITGSLLAHIFTIDGNHKHITKKLLNAFYELFDAREWHVYKLNTMYLLIPRIGTTQLEDFNLSSGKFISTDSKDALQKESAGTYFGYRSNRSGSGIEGADVLAVIQILLSGMVNKVERNWVIYLGGHGGYKQSIAGFNFDNFKKLINFFDKNIKTKLFVYSSCYAAGFNAGQVYGELKYSIDSGAESQGRVDPVRAGFRPIQDIRTYPFAIVTSATTDAPTYGGQVDVNGEESEMRYDEFVKEVQKESINYSLALGYLFPLIKRPALLAGEIASIPLIRPAHVPAWFPVADVNKAVIRIGNVMAYAKEKKRDSLVVKQYKGIDGEKHDPKAIVLAVPEIQFPIVIDAGIKKIPPFIAAVPGTNRYFLQSLRYPGKVFQHFNIQDIIGGVQYAESKEFIIGNFEICSQKSNPCSGYKRFDDMTIDYHVRPNESVDIKAYSNCSEENCTWFLNTACDTLRQNIKKRDMDAVRKTLNDDSIDSGQCMNYMKATDQRRESVLSLIAGVPGDYDDSARMCIQYGADVNYGSDSWSGQTALHQACEVGNIKIVKLLVGDKDFNAINVRDKRLGLTALHLAVDNGSSDVVEQLLQSRDVQVDIQDNDGNTPLMDAVDQEKRDIVKLLLKKCADPDSKGRDDLSPRDKNPLLVQEVEREIAQEESQKRVGGEEQELKAREDT